MENCSLVISTIKEFIFKNWNIFIEKISYDLRNFNHFQKIGKRSDNKEISHYKKHY